MMSVCGRALALLILGYFFIGCSHPENQAPEQNAVQWRLGRLSVEQKADLAPHAIFEAVLVGDLSLVKDLAEKEPKSLSLMNTYGDTALGLALEVRQEALAIALVEALQPQELYHQNKKGEGYVFQAARAGYFQIINTLADRVWSSKSRFEDFEFQDLDLENQEQQRAIHVASNRQVIEWLKHQYHRGWLEFPFFQFSMKKDKNGRSFLHTAAVDGRADILKWGVENMCQGNAWERSQSTWKSFVGTAGTYALRVLQSSVGDWVGLNHHFNWQDNEGNTPLHLSVMSLSIQAVQALASCTWTDYLIPNHQGDLPLHTLLKGVDPQVEVDSIRREIFDLLLNRRTLLKKWMKSESDYLEHANQDGQVLAHLAAGLADTYFYEKLKAVSNVQLPNQRGQTPADIEAQRGKQIEAYGK